MDAKAYFLMMRGLNCVMKAVLGIFTN